jgi:hypothetical protein
MFEKYKDELFHFECSLGLKDKSTRNCMIGSIYNPMQEYIYELIK